MFSKRSSRSVRSGVMYTLFGIAQHKRKKPELSQLLHEKMQLGGSLLVRRILCRKRKQDERGIAGLRR